MAKIKLGDLFNYGYFLFLLFSMYFYFTFNNFLLGLIVSLIFVILCSAFIGLKTKWVRIEYKTPDQKTERAYFASSSGFGWGGIAGGTQSLFNLLNSNSNNTSSVPSQ